MVHSVVPAIALISVAVLGVFSMLGPLGDADIALVCYRRGGPVLPLSISVGNLGGFFGPYIIAWTRDATVEFRGGLLAIAAALAVSGTICAGGSAEICRKMSARPDGRATLQFTRRVRSVKNLKLSASYFRPHCLK